MVLGAPCSTAMWWYTISKPKPKWHFERPCIAKDRLQPPSEQDNVGEEELTTSTSPPKATKEKPDSAEVRFQHHNDCHMQRHALNILKIANAILEMKTFRKSWVYKWVRNITTIELPLTPENLPIVKRRLTKRLICWLLCRAFRARRRKKRVKGRSQRFSWENFRSTRIILSAPLFVWHFERTLIKNWKDSLVLI